MSGVRFTALEYLALVGAVALLESYAADQPEIYAKDVPAANRALAKARASLTSDSEREVQWRLAGPSA